MPLTRNACAFFRLFPRFSAIPWYCRVFLEMPWCFACFFNGFFHIAELHIYYITLHFASLLVTLVHCWSTFGSLWLTFSSRMVYIWLTFGSLLVQWFTLGSLSVHVWFFLGSNLSSRLSIVGSLLVHVGSLWFAFGSRLVHAWFTHWFTLGSRLVHF